MLGVIQAYDNDLLLLEFAVLNFDPSNFRSAEISISLNTFNAIIFRETTMDLTSQ